MTNDLHINDLFWTVQGEGANAGRRALFVRMPYCNLACEWCDTSFNSFKKWSEEDFKAFARQEQAAFAVITGGEPMLNKHTPRVHALLRELDFEVAVETNGTVAPNILCDFFTVSPKRQAKVVHQPRPPAGTGIGYYDPYYVHPEMWAVASEFKYVVDSEFDFGVLERHKLDPNRLKRRHSLSPEFNTFDASLEKIIAYQKENPEWRISLQTHKWMKVP